ncbi:hypothetical protein [Glaciimonas sp. PCH181]|uniref:hypothetical protein n=1 Tax=Glaciimonas sp. PCH181 TaxID=2133943 RepID=UPI000D38CB28|nr:hypothetical protein [Glaciimonas sp. PCH181]PUA18413.1 hypothetical protein C7W93_00095 [Glaciimonas sp. PCH181]
MGVTKFQGNAAVDVVSRQYKNNGEMNSGGKSAVSDQANAGIFDAQRIDTAGIADPDREWERRKWMLQMGTIVLMGISGLGLHFFLKTIPRTSVVEATSSAVFDKDCKQIDQSYSSGAGVDTTNAATQACLAQRALEQNRSFNEK